MGWSRLRKRLLGGWLLLIFGGPMGLYTSSVIGMGTLLLAVIWLFALTFALFSKKVSFQLSVCVAILASASALYAPQGMARFVDALNLRIQDAFFLIRGPRPNTDQIRIVDIDEESLRELGQWPLPRTVLARAVELLQEDGAKVIGFNIVFAEPDRMSLKEWASRLQMMGLQLKLPWKSLAQSHADIDRKDWSYEVSEQQMRQIVIREWRQRLGCFPEKRDDEVLEHFLENDRRVWKQKLGAVAYPDHRDPLTLMKDRAYELFFFKDRSIVVDNDKELGAVFQADNVVAAGLMTFERSGSELANEGMVISSPIENAKAVFPYIRVAKQQVLNIPKIQNHVRRQGMFNLFRDASGSAHHYTLLMQGEVRHEGLILKEGMDVAGEALLDPQNYERAIVTRTHSYPSLALEMFLAGTEFKKIEPKIIRSRRGVLLCDADQTVHRFVPLDSKGDLAINFLGKGYGADPELEAEAACHFPYVSLSDVVERRFPKGFFKDRFVIIGSTNPTIASSVNTPFNRAFPGIEIHATVLDNLISQDFLVADGIWSRFLRMLEILFGGILLSFTICYSPPWVAGPLTGAVLLGLPLRSYWEFSHSGSEVQIALTWFSAALLTAVSVMISFFFEGRERRFVTGQFAKMVSPHVLEELRASSDLNALSAKRAQVTVMFSDIHGFTSFSEKIAPDKVVSMLNNYLEKMTELIMKSDGFVDKFIGDAIMACWGAPVSDEKHALLACQSALAQQEYIEKHKMMSVRMGLASGEAAAAFIGSSDRKSYTVLGDTVNLGARIEPACRVYGTRIILSEATYELVKDEVEARLLDKAIFKGKTVPICIYELIGLKGDVDKERLQFRDEYEKALRLMWERRFEDSRKVLESLPQDDLSVQRLQRRVKSYQKIPPPTNWEGEDYH